MGLVEGALGREIASEVQEVKLHPGTGKLVARMADGFGRAQLENIEINQDKLLAADTGAKFEIRTLTKLCVSKMFKTAGGRVKSFIITTKSTEPEFDFLSRNFVPWAGIPEDAGKICSCNRPFWTNQEASLFSSSEENHNYMTIISRIDETISLIVKICL